MIGLLIPEKPVDGNPVEKASQPGLSPSALVVIFDKSRDVSCKGLQNS